MMPSVHADPVEILGLTFADLGRVVRIHLAAFPNSLMSRLGGGVVSVFYQYQLESEEGLAAIGAFRCGELVGYCFLREGRGSGSFLRARGFRILWAMLRHPRVLMDSGLWRSCLQIGASLSERVATNLPQTRCLVLSVDPAWCRKGIASRLMAAAEKLALAHGSTALGLTVHADNTAAVAFYLATGWAKVREENGWSGQMEKPLRPVLTGSISGSPFEYESERIRREYIQRRNHMPPPPLRQSEVHLYFEQMISRHLAYAVERYAPLRLQSCSILDVGCGGAGWLLQLIRFGADPGRCFGIDLDGSRVEIASASLPRGHVQTGDATDLPWPEEFFDIVTQFTMCTSVMSNLARTKIASEMVRVAKPGGILIWFDFRVNNPANPNVRGIKESEVRSLFAGNEIVRCCSVILAPPLARRVVPISWILALICEKVPFFRTHQFIVIRKARSSGPTA